MKNMKKLFFAAVGAISLGILASCGGQTGNPDDAILARPESADFKGFNVVGDNIKVGEGDAAKPLGKWGYGENGNMVATSISKIAEKSKAVADKLKGNVEYVYMLEHVQLGTEAVKAGWATKAIKNGEVITLDGGYCAKVISYKYDSELENPYVGNGWFPSAENHYSNLTPDSLYSLPKNDTKDLAGNDHNGNPAVFEGGLYTIVLAKFKDKVEDCMIGYGAILEKKLTSYDITASVDLAKLTIVGKINGTSDWNTGVAMTKEESGAYTATVTLAANDEIKVRANDAWTYSWGFNALTDGKTNFTDADGNIKIAEAGTYVIRIGVPSKLSPISCTATTFTVVKQA